MCCGCVQWCDTDELLVLVVVMNNIVPLTGHSLSVTLPDRQRAPSRDEEFFSFLIVFGEATQDMCGVGCVCMCGIKGSLMYSHSWERGGGGRTERQLAEQRVSVTRSQCDSHSDSFVPTHLCQSQRVDG